MKIGCTLSRDFVQHSPKLCFWPIIVSFHLILNSLLVLSALLDCLGDVAPLSPLFLREVKHCKSPIRIYLDSLQRVPRAGIRSTYCVEYICTILYDHETFHGVRLCLFD